MAEGDLKSARAKAIEMEHEAAVALVRLQRAVGGPGVAEWLEDCGPGEGPGQIERRDAR
jgi:hypothetical protein